jgi:hypothetical protein
MQDVVLNYLRGANGETLACVAVSRNGDFGVSIKHPTDLPDKKKAREVAVARAYNGHNKVPSSGQKVFVDGRKHRLDEVAGLLLEHVQERAKKYFKWDEAASPK